MTDPAHIFPQPLLKSVAEATRATDDDVRALRRRLVERGILAGSTRTLLQAAGEGTRTSYAPRLRPRHPVRVRWSHVGAWALAGAVALGVLGYIWRPPVPPPPSEALALTLESPELAQQTSPSPEVALVFQGHGHVEGKPEMPRIAWERGLLEVEVEPGRGIDLWVTTREARIRVVGTGFSVDRDENGTHVAVAHGVVEVRCVAGTTVLLTEGQTQVCDPVSAAALLGKARVMQSQGASTEDILFVAEAARATATPGTAVAAEVDVLHFELLVSLDRIDEALQVADAYVAAPASPRSDDIRRIAAGLAYRVGGCDRARSYLEALGAPPADPTLAACAER